MFLTKEEILSQNLVSEILSDSQFQPSGVDLTLREIHEFVGAGKIDFDNKERKLSETRRIAFSSEEIHLSQGAYKIIYNEFLRIPEDCVALAFPRSSLLRCGAFLQCALWDPGYEGRSESLLIVANPHGITLKRNAKVVQLVFLKLREKAAHPYSGRYKGENK